MARQPYMTTSWDDGHPLDLRIAEMLAKHGLRGTFYVPRSSQTETMTLAQVRELGRGFEIGAHTLHHCVLPTVAAHEAEAEIAGSKGWVEDTTGQPCRVFCPPKGKYRAEHVEMVRRAGYMSLRSVELASIDYPRVESGILVQPTSVQVHPHGLMAYARNAAARRAPGNLWRYISHGCSRDWYRMAQSVLQEALQHGGVFHLWGHSWELDRTGQWDRLDDVMRLMSEFSGKAPVLTNGDLRSSARRKTVMCLHTRAEWSCSLGPILCR